MLSQAVEDYLKTIYKLQSAGAATTTAIAQLLDVSAASVTNMIKRLAAMELVAHTSYRGVTLTPAGEKIALEIIRHHRLIELYLNEVLGYSWDQVHEEAEHLEHHISEQFEDRIAELLGHPTHDPHGDPIPDKNGEMPAGPSDPLSGFEPGQIVVIRRVADADPHLLRYLAEIGLVPKVTVEVLAKAPFNGPLTVRVGQQEQVVGREVASQVFAAPAGAE